MVQMGKQLVCFLEVLHHTFTEWIFLGEGNVWGFNLYVVPFLFLPLLSLNLRSDFRCRCYKNTQVMT